MNVPGRSLPSLDLSSFPQDTTEDGECVFFACVAERSVEPPKNQATILLRVSPARINPVYRGPIRHSAAKCSRSIHIERQTGKFAGSYLKPHLEPFSIQINRDVQLARCLLGPIQKTRRWVLPLVLSLIAPNLLSVLFPPSLSLLDYMIAIGATPHFECRLPSLLMTLITFPIISAVLFQNSLGMALFIATLIFTILVWITTGHRRPLLVCRPYSAVQPAAGHLLGIP